MKCLFSSTVCSFVCYCLPFTGDRVGQYPNYFRHKAGYKPKLITGVYGVRGDPVWTRAQPGGGGDFWVTSLLYLKQKQKNMNK